MVARKEEKTVELALDHKDLAKVKKVWPWKANAFDAVTVVQIVQFLKPAERIHFVNELFRVLKKGGKAQILTPHWATNHAYGDLAYEMPPVAEAWYLHLNAEWRKANAPWGTKYKCDFDIATGYSLHPLIETRNQEYKMHAVTFWKEAAQAMSANLTKK